MAFVKDARSLGSDYELFDVLILALLVLASVHFLMNAMTSLVGKEIFRVHGGYLIHGWRLFGLKRESSYRVSDIRLLSADRGFDAPDAKRLISPLWDFGKLGIIKFDYGTRTISMGAAVDEEMGGRIADWLIRRLPRSATEY